MPLRQETGVQIRLDDVAGSIWQALGDGGDFLADAYVADAYGWGAADWIGSPACHVIDRC